MKRYDTSSKTIQPALFQMTFFLSKDLDGLLLLKTTGFY